MPALIPATTGGRAAGWRARIWAVAAVLTGVAAGAAAQAPAEAQETSPSPPAEAAAPGMGASADLAADHPLFGVWQNPSGSVHIRASACGEHLCGTVVYANDKAKADAAKAGTPELIGLNLFQEFAAGGPNEWHGKVLVPDLDRTVKGRIELVGAGTIKVEGCLFGHVACRDQLWTRVE